LLLLYGLDHRPRQLLSFPTRRSSDLRRGGGDLPFHEEDRRDPYGFGGALVMVGPDWHSIDGSFKAYENALATLAKELIVNGYHRSEEHTSELQSRENLVCRLLLAKKK